MSAYAGPGNFPYWLTIVNTGAQANPQAISENIPVQVGTVYNFDVVASYATTYASGFEVFITWYNANGAVISSSSPVSQANMTGGVLYEVNSANQTAPANSSYAVVTIQCLGTPAETNPLQVYHAQVQDAAGNIVNVNYAFTYTTWPWTANGGNPTLAWNTSPVLPGDSDSLVLDNTIELMGGAQGVQCLVPELLDSNGQGPTFRLLAPPSLNSAGLGYQSSYDLNAPQPTQDVVASMLLDGERPFGDRASNRTMHFPVAIFGTMAGGMSQVLKAREYLMYLIDQQQFPLKWTSADTGLPMLFDCFRALASEPVYGAVTSAGGTATGQTIGRPNYPIAFINLNIQALPYGRSDIDGVQNLAFASPIVGGINPQTVPASTLDTFNTFRASAPILSTPAWTSLGTANPTSVSSWNIAAGTSAAAGNTLVAEIESAGSTITGITDARGNVYSQAGSNTVPAYLNYESLVAASSPAAYWPMQEATGSSTVADTSGNGHTGTVVGSPTLGASGPLGGLSETYTGAANQEVTTTYNPSGQSSFSVECWVNLSATAGQARIMSTGAAGVAGQGGFSLFVNGTTAFLDSGDGTSVYRATASFPAGLLNTWVHLCATWTSGGNTTVYVNGTPGTGVAVTAGRTLTAGTNSMNLGANDAVWNVSISGSVAHCAFYPTALSSGTITSHATAVPTLQSIWTAPVDNPLSVSDNLTITASGSGNFSSAWYKVSGSWTPTVAFKGSQTAATYNQTFSNISQYTMLVQATAGLGSSGGVSTGWTSIGTNSGNGFNSTMAYFSVPVNQSSGTASISSLPNPSSVMILSFAPVNQYWNQDVTTPPPTFIGHSVRFVPPRPFKQPYPAATYARTLNTPVSIVGLPVLSMYFGQAYDTQWARDPKFVSNVIFYWTLTDDLGRTLTFSKLHKKTPWGTHPTTPKWTMINAAIPQGRAFNYNSVVSYSVRIVNWQASGKTGYIRMYCWLNFIVANPQTIQNAPSPRGAVYQLLGLPGAARAPVSVQCQLPAAQDITKEITTPSSGTWIVPPGVYSVQAEAWAGGGAGSSTNTARTMYTGGGGGGEYAQEPALSVLPGQRIPWTIGAGGTAAQLAPTVVQFSQPGLGHWTCPANVNNVLVETWGGGGAGGAGSGGGGGGEYSYANVPVTPGTTYATWTAAGGKADTGTSAAQVAARQGQTSWFGSNSNHAGNTALVSASGGHTSLTGSTSGGTGGDSGNVKPSAFAWRAAANPSGNVTSGTLSATTGSPILVAGHSALVIVTVTAAATITVKDSSGNPYTQIASSSSTGAFTYVFVSYSAKGINHSGSVTVTQSVSQHLMANFYDLPSVVGIDVASVTASGTGTSASVTSNTANYAGDAVFAIFSSTVNSTNSVPANWTHVQASNSNVSPVLNIDVFEQYEATTAGLTCAPTYASSTTWSALTLTFLAVNRYAGGRGGTSPGPSGGGGGGAGGANGIGGAGGNSQPFVANVGQWQQGGTGGTGGGTGASQGGNGGAGAGTPGFPGIGVVPGGGGGGGYQTAPVFNPSNPSNALPGQKQVNYLGADGGQGLVQLTYQVGNGLPVNGGNTTFGSTALTGTIVTAHGGTSATTNSATGAAGGTGSSNTIHNNGGSGGLIIPSAAGLGSYMTSAFKGFFTTLSSGTWNSTANTSGTSAASVSQGVAVALIASAASVTDLVVTDSAGNLYQLQSTQAAPTSGITVYAYVADIEFPITTSTTLTVAGATSQQYGFMWYGSPYLTTGVSAGNISTNSGTSATASAQFGTTDNDSILWELGVTVCDGSKTVNGIGHGGQTWFNASSTNALTFNSTCQLSTFIALNQGGGTGAASTGDTFSASLSGSANWATIVLPLVVINQQAAVIQFQAAAGVTPGSQTTWSTNGAAMQAHGMLVVAGQNGSGASVTSAPTAIADSAGNVYTMRKTTILPSNGGVMWLATAPVTAALPATATGTINWGTASASPNYSYEISWLPNAVAVDANGVSAVTGSNNNPTATYTPASPNDLVFAHSTVVSAANAWSGWTNGFDWTGATSQNYMRSQDFAYQDTDLAAVPFSVNVSTAMPWGVQMMGFTQSPGGAGGGAAGGPNNAGYLGVWNYGAPAYAGGGKGGNGAPPSVTGPGGGASYPGGGGGGAYGTTAASATPQNGGQGAPGAIRLTWTPPLQTFNTLIVHSLGADADPNVNPVTPIPITDTPNNTEYAVPSINGIMNATFNSTYTVMLSNFYWDASTIGSPRQITVTVNQYEYPGGPKYSVQCSRSVTPATDVVNGLFSMGEVTLPVKDYLKHNDQSYFTVSINDTNANDRFQDILMLDTLGQTIFTNIDPGQPGYGQYVNYFFDEGTSDRDLGFMGASMQDRQHQIGVMDYTQISGGALYVGPGDNLFMVYSTAGAPNLALQYSPRWYLDRSVLS